MIHPLLWIVGKVGRLTLGEDVPPASPEKSPVQHPGKS
jgi:hypothetical protein